MSSSIVGTGSRVRQACTMLHAYLTAGMLLEIVESASADSPVDEKTGRHPWKPNRRPPVIGLTVAGAHSLYSAPEPLYMLPWS